MNIAAINVKITFQKNDVVIDSNIISVSKFVSHITSKYSVDDIDIEGELIDDMIIKLYKYYEI